VCVQEQKEQILGDSIKEHEEAMVQLRRHMKEMESQMLALTDNAQMLKQLVLCQSCCKRLRNVILLPCMHLLFCSKCVKELKRKHKEDALAAAAAANTANHHAVGGSKDSAKPRSLAAAAAAKHGKTREPFRCPKCSVEVRGKMKCEMGC
jgi:late competence protein required for DNA uptake (superfamily II DNA/RNA helicase)